MKRRSFLRCLAPGAAALPLAGTLALGAGGYRVGAGRSSDPYDATVRAVQASGEWPAMSGLAVMIKPNLVAGQPSTSGVTTDPQVVRALVDMALDSGAASVTIVEGGGHSPANFTSCGYDFLRTYDSRVQLLDFASAPLAVVNVPRGLTYFRLYLPAPAVEPGLVFISAGKMKTHVNSVASLSMKNIFGLASPQKYSVAGQLPRQDGHSRGIDQSVVDVNLSRPISFSVIDGVWGLEGEGPLSGTPVPSNVVFAGRNPAATDRAALDFMGIAQSAVPHLAYAAWRGIGPSGMDSITMLGDSYTPMPFKPAVTGPVVWRPTIHPDPISLSAHRQATIYYEVSEPCDAAVDILYDNDLSPAIKQVRGLQNWTPVPAGVSSVQWDLNAAGGAPVPPTIYLARVIATANKRFTYATGWIQVTA
ncbi:MAG TPA: DUF362 domain-containing protein [Bryobacteraceae bacterium]|nr:DUF362 domain-containing protein [Bryobacteraceae bacterium]